MIVALHIINSGSARVSQPSVILHEQELSCLNSDFLCVPARVHDWQVDTALTRVHVDTVFTLL